MSEASVRNQKLIVDLILLALTRQQELALLLGKIISEAREPTEEEFAAVEAADVAARQSLQQAINERRSAGS